MSDEPKDPGNLFINASNHPTAHADLERIGVGLEGAFRRGGTKTMRVRLALFIAARMDDRELLEALVAMTERDFLGEVVA